MVIEEWLSLFSLSRAHFLPRGLSDHCPAVLHLGTPIKRVFKPFQVFHHIIKSPEFITTVRNAWNVNIEGDPWYILNSKLHRVKRALKTLNASTDNLHNLVVEARNNLAAYQDSLPTSPSSDQLIEEERLSSALSTTLCNEELITTIGSSLILVKVVGTIISCLL